MTKEIASLGLFFWGMTRVFQKGPPFTENFPHLAMEIFAEAQFRVRACGSSERAVASNDFFGVSSVVFLVGFIVI
jgi:hypothetical protein